MDERRLLLAWKGGDRAAGRVLFDRYFLALRRFFRNKVDEAADDLAQATLLRCLEASDGLRVDASFRAWLFAIARNELFAHFRRRSRQNAFEPEVTCVDDAAESPSRVLAQRSERRVVLESLRRIPLDSQVVLELYYWEDMSTRELSEMLDVPESTARSRLARARGLLAERLRELEHGTPLATTADDIDAWARRVRDVAHEDDS